MKQVTIKEIQATHGLTAPEANGLIKSLVKFGLVKKVDTRKAQGETGRGRTANVYEIADEIIVKL